MRSGLIRNQHIVLKLAIFIIGISSSIEVSQRQMAAQSLLILIYMVPEPRLYGSFLFALRKLISWFAAYWVFALLFKVEFPDAVMFCVTIMYLALITVVVWASVDKSRIWDELAALRKLRCSRGIVSYVLATYLFLKQYLAILKQKQMPDGIVAVISSAIDSGKLLHANAPKVAEQVETLMNQEGKSPASNMSANLYGLLFLSLLGLVFSI